MSKATGCSNEGGTYDEFRESINPEIAPGITISWLYSTDEMKMKAAAQAYSIGQRLGNFNLTETDLINFFKDSSAKDFEIFLQTQSESLNEAISKTVEIDSEVADHRFGSGKFSQPEPKGKLDTTGSGEQISLAEDINNVLAERSGTTNYDRIGTAPEGRTGIVSIAVLGGDVEPAGEHQVASDLF